ncbi:MAG: hypothetical protein IIV81_03110 [Clostridia bacterium]|nr:hypothetical protein [Clostridia bacterium]
MKKNTEKILRELDVEKEGNALDMEELEAFRLEKRVKKNLEEEIKKLLEIFPDFDTETIPDEVFDKCEDGRGLAAEYALWYLTEEKRKGEQQKKEEENDKSAPPNVKDSSEPLYFTPEQVRAMSESEIRKNYKTIMNSMEKWK